MATKLSKAGMRSEVSVAELDMDDDAAWDSWSERIGARSARVLDAEKQRLQGLGLINEDWSQLAADGVQL